MFSSMDDVRKVKGGASIETIEGAISFALSVMRTEGWSWADGIELISSLIHRRAHDGSELPEGISKDILAWIEQAYELDSISEIPLSFNADTADGIHFSKLIEVFQLTINTLYHLSPRSISLPLLRERLEHSNNEFEKYEVQEAITYLEYIPVTSLAVADDIKDHILERTDRYFQDQFDQRHKEHLLCGLRETVFDHGSCYSISWCLKDEKYLPPPKRTVSVGGGRLFLRKNQDVILMAGSAQENPVEWFELEVNQEEIFWELVIQYDKKVIGNLKVILNLSTSEILRTLNEEKQIIMEDDELRLAHLKKSLDGAGIANELSRKRRPRGGGGV